MRFQVWGGGGNDVAGVLIRVAECSFHLITGTLKSESEGVVSKSPNHCTIQVF